MNPFVRPRVRSGRHVIPRITDERGVHWKQPDRAQILLDDDVAYMTRKTWNALPKYSATIPTGVYPGKMWGVEWRSGNLLRWFGESTDPAYCSNHQRRVEIVE